MKCFVDGNMLAVVKDGFVDLQESSAIFIPIKKQIKEIHKTIDPLEGREK